MTLKDPVIFFEKGRIVSDVPFFLQKVGFFEFVHGKYSEVGGGNLKNAKVWKTLVVCVCLMQNFKKQTTVM